MRQIYLSLAFITFLFTQFMRSEWDASAHYLADNLSVRIFTPAPGEEIRGMVEIRGSTGPDDIRSYEVAFTYTGDKTQTWFLIQRGETAIVNGLLATWDTSKITDGDYSLRLLVLTADGKKNEVVAPGLRARNDAPVGSANLPSLGYGEATAYPLAPDITQNSQIFSKTPTAFLPNPIEITSSDVTSILGTGAAFSISIFVLLGTYLGYRNWIRKHK